MQPDVSSRGTSAFAKLNPQDAARLLAQSVAGSRAFGAKSAPFRALLVVALVALTAANVTRIVPFAVSAALTLVLLASALDYSMALAKRSEPLQKPIEALTVAVGPIAAAALVAQALKSMRSPADRHHAHAAWLAALVVAVTHAASTSCASGHHPGCVHHRLSNQLPADTPPELAAALR